MFNRYWKVICRYGHVGKGNEISAARYIKTNEDITIIEVMELVSQMPGVKFRGVSLIYEIDEQSYLSGKVIEAQNIFLQKLMTHKPLIMDKNYEGGFTPCA